MQLFYDRAGNPIDPIGWGHLMEDPDYWFVALTVVGDSMVATTWKGIEPTLITLFYPADQRSFRLVFETQVCDRHGRIVPIDDDEVTRWYASAEAAALGHDAIVAGLVGGLKPGMEVRQAGDPRTAYRLWRGFRADAESALREAFRETMADAAASFNVEDGLSHLQRRLEVDPGGSDG